MRLLNFSCLRFLWNKCGIWAIFGLGRKAARGLDSTLKISQRGPDLTRFESLPGFKDSFIGFHRLSVLDDAHGLAPVHVNQYPHLQVMANCAIFNWKELGAKHGLQFQTSCDDEVITHLLVEHGVKKTAQWLDGVFSFVAIDKEKKKIHIAHDTFGVRPMFTMITAEDQLMGVCSEVKGLIHLKREKYNIQPFPPGCCATYDLDPRGKASLVEWGEYTHVGKAPEYDTNVQLKSDDVKYNIRTLLKEAVRKRLMGSRGVGSFFSGGLDSSLVSALVAQCAKESGIAKPIRTFTIGMEGSPDGYRSWISPSLPTTSGCRRRSATRKTERRNTFCVQRTTSTTFCHRKSCGRQREMRLDPALRT